MNKVEREKLKKKVVKLMQELKAEPGNFLNYEWKVQTTLGPLLVHYSLECGTVFTRFKDPKRAREMVRCNPYSGKWNFHFGKTSADAAFASVEPALRAITPA
jgi:hypothetical protein